MPMYRLNQYRLNQLSQRQLAEVADENFVVHVGWAQQQAAGMQCFDDGRLFYADAGLPTDTFNVICRARLTEDETPARIAATLAHFRTVGRPFAWWVGPADQPATLGEALLAAGLEAAGTEIAMAVDLARVQSAALQPDGLTIRRVHTLTELQDFAQVMAANWNPPDPQVLIYYMRTAASLLGPDAPQWFYVGYLDDQPVAVSELTISGGVEGGVVGLYSVCTLEAFRRRGFGMALTLYPLLEARAVGYHVGVLQASEQGARIYERLGFQAFGGITEYKPVAL